MYFEGPSIVAGFDLFPRAGRRTVYGIRPYTDNALRRDTRTIHQHLWDLWYSESVLFQVRNKWTRRENRLPGNCPTWIGRGPYGHMPQNVPSSSLKQVYRPSSTDPEKQATASCFELLSAAQRNPVEDDPAIVYALMRGNESPGWAQPSSYGGLRARLQTHTPGIVNQLSYGGIRHHVTNADLADFGGPWWRTLRSALNVAGLGWIEAGRKV
ncbi:hypothetical protein B0H11DRAFT_1941638 [Mycena galericulata]|nr:hypothetical protein B0H11DRAFT_1941638 [Mycena galericulata]